MGIVNIELNYTDDDFQNLVTYKLFNQHIRPLLLEKNPKLVMYRMVSVIGAKWREFIELREHKEKDQQQKTTAQDDEEDTQKSEESSGGGSTAASSKPASNEPAKEPEDTKDTEEKGTVEETEEPVLTGRGRSRRASKKRDYAETDEVNL